MDEVLKNELKRSEAIGGRDRYTRRKADHVQEKESNVQNIAITRDVGTITSGRPRYAVNYKESEMFTEQSIRSIARDHFPERLSQRRRRGYTSEDTDRTCESADHTGEKGGCTAQGAITPTRGAVAADFSCRLVIRVGSA